MSPAAPVSVERARSIPSCPQQSALHLVHAAGAEVGPVRAELQAFAAAYSMGTIPEWRLWMAPALQA